MSPRRTLLLALLLTSASAAPADAQTTRLRGRVMDLDGQPVRDVRLRILDHGEPEIFDSGEFQLQLAGRPSRVDVQVLDSTLQVLYPPRGVIAIPADPDEPVQIVVGRRERDYLGDAIAGRLVTLERTLRANGVEYTASVDSLGESMRQIIAILRDQGTDVNRQLERERLQGGLKPGLLRTIEAYLIELKDLRNAFELVSRYAANDIYAVQTLRDAMLAYNTAADSLIRNRDAYAAEIRRSWVRERAELLVRDLENVYVLAEDDIHRGYVLPLNESLLVLQLAYTPNKPGKQQVQQAAADAGATVRALTPRIPVLEERVRQLRSALEQN